MDDEAKAIPVAVWSGSFRLFGVEVKCHTLSTGERIIEAESMHRLFEAMSNGEDYTEHDAADFSRWQRGLPPPKADA